MSPSDSRASLDKISDSGIMALVRTFRRWTRYHYAGALIVFIFVTVVVFQHADISGGTNSRESSLGHLEKHRDLNAEYNYEASDLVHYKKDIPLIWIGGVPRSGTTLMRVLLDAHEDVRCGEETRVIPRLLGMHAGMMRSELEMNRLKEAHIDESVLDSALGAYLLSIISLHGEPASRLCNKDPFTLRSMSRILSIFPRSQFLLMLRDGRATAHSIISRKVTIKGFDIKSYAGALRDWNRAIEAMYEECLKAGPDICLPVHYEQLVLHPESQMRRILEFLNIEWSDNVLHHEKQIGKDISLSKKELSTDQVDKPVNLEALTKWAQYFPDDVKPKVDEIAPMLRRLGYDPTAFPPDYGKPDELVRKNSERMKAQKIQKQNDAYIKYLYQGNYVDDEKN